MYRSRLSAGLGLFAAVAIPALLWVPGLNEYHINGDEALHLLCTELVRKNPFSAWQQIMKTYAHPPLYMYLLSLIRLIFGLNHLMVWKIASILFGMLALAVGYVWGSDRGTRPWIGAIILLLLATSPLLGEQAQLIRSYALLLPLIMLVYFFLTKPNFEKKDLTLCLFAFCAAFLTHYSALILAPTIMLAVFLRTKHWGNHQRIRSVAVVALLGLAMGSLLAVTRLQSSYGAADLAYAFRPLHNTKEFLTVTKSVFDAFFGNTASWLPLAALVVSLPIMIRQKSWSTLLLSWGPLAVALFLGYYKLYPFNQFRHVVYLIPATLVPVIYLLSLMKQNWAPKLTLGALLVIAATSHAFEPNRYRKNKFEFAQRWTELGPLKDDILSGKFGDGVIVLDRHNYTVMQVERQLRPKWSLYGTAKQQFAVCNNSYFQPSVNCSCVEKIGGTLAKGKKFYFLVANATLPPITDPQLREDCLADAVVRVSENFSLARFSAN